MNKLIVVGIVGVLALFSFEANGQFQQNDKLLNLGVGLNSYYAGGLPLTASFEVGITKEISIGAGFDYLSYRYAYPGGNWKFRTLYFGGRGSFHLSELLNLDVKEVDLYAGAALGFRSFSWNDNYTFGNTGFSDKYGNGLFVGLFGGCRYYLQDNLGLFGELGIGGSSNARVGVALKF